MSEYARRLEEAAIPELVAEIRARIDSPGGAFWDWADDQESGIRDRIQRVLDHALVVTGSSDPALIPVRWVDDLRTDLAKLNSDLGLVQDSSDVIASGLVSDVSSSIEEVASELMQWPFHGTTEDWRDAVSAAASTYRRSLSQQIASLVTEIEAVGLQAEALKAQLAEIDQQGRLELAERAGALSQQVADASSEVANVVARANALDSQVAKSLDRINETMTAQQQQFSDAQEARTREAATVRDKLIDDSNRLLETQEVGAASLVAAIQQHVDEAATLVSVFAAAGTANAFGKEAKEQGDTADAWRTGAIVLGVISAIAAGAVFFGVSAGEAAWQLFIGKLAISLTFGGLAGYAARQSSRHRRREESARHLELNLATFGPLAEELDADELQTARGRLVQAMLDRESRANRETVGSADMVGPAQVELIRQLFDIAVKQR